MLPSWIAVVAGLLLLIWGADRFVEGAASIARNLGISPLMIGLTVIAFGTSAPEMLVSATAAWQGNTGLSIGNAIGSNITNIALVLGATALIVPLHVEGRILRVEVPMLVAVTVLAGYLMLDYYLDRRDGIVLLVAMAGMLLLMIRLAQRAPASEPMSAEFAQEMPRRMSTPAAIAWTLAGLVVLLLSSRLLVFGAVQIAQSLGVSDLVIGLTIVAIGTSLPELAASIASALKKETDIAIGNVIGSNMFNLLPVLAMPGLIHPAAVPAAAMHRDYLVMAVLTLVLFIMARGFRGPGRITRIEGAVLLGIFGVYQWRLYHVVLT